MVNEDFSDSDQSEEEAFLDSSLKQLQDYYVDTVGQNKYLLKHRTRDDLSIKVYTKRISEDFILWAGVPRSLEKEMDGFWRRDYHKYPGTILKTALMRIQHPKEALKTSAEIERRIENAMEVKEEDPSQHYDPLN